MILRICFVLGAVAAALQEQRVRAVSAERARAMAPRFGTVMQATVQP